jgi:hypothetical protein
VTDSDPLPLRATVQQALQAWETKGPTSLTVALLADALYRVQSLHRPVQWKGWRLWINTIAREPRAYVNKWCAECHKPWPCPTVSTKGDK